MMNRMINRNLPSGLLAALLCLAPPVFTACQEEPAKITITMVSDYSQLIEAINNVSRSLSEKVELVETALSSGFADSKAAQQMLQQAVASLSGTAAEKLAAIEEAVKSQTASLEMKLGLIEAAVANGFANSVAQQALLQTAIESLSGTTAEKLALIEGAMKSQVSSLETKLGLIETAIKDGLADEKASQELLQQAVGALTGTASERLQAIEKAVESQTASLSSKIDLIDAAVENRLADTNEALALLQQAVEALSGTVAEKLVAIEEVVKNQTTTLETKLDLIESAVAGGFADKDAKYALLQQAVEALDGTIEEKLAALSAAIESKGTSLSSKLALIETAIKTGLADEQAGQQLIEEAIGTLDGTLKEKLAAIKQAIDDQTTSLASKIDLIDQAVQDSLASSQAAQALLQQAFAALDSTTSARLDTLSAVMNRQTTALWAKLELIELAVRDSLLNTQSAIGQIETAIASLSTALGSTDPNTASVLNGLTAIQNALDVDLAAALSEIFNKINGLTDYSEILAAIETSLTKIVYGHDLVDMGNGPKWATCNIGAENPWDYGDFFAWGETTPKDRYVWANYFDGDGTTFTVYAIGKKTVLDPGDDAATVNWGSKWRMPTDAEWTWLRTKCTWVWTSQNGVSGMLVTAPNGNSIFLPAAGIQNGFVVGDTGSYGNYWSSSLDKTSSKHAMCGFFTSTEPAGSSGLRSFGRSVRPVAEK